MPLSPEEVRLECLRESVKSDGHQKPENVISRAKVYLAFVQSESSVTTEVAPPAETEVTDSAQGVQAASPAEARATSGRLGGRPPRK